jgi:hypothetical protein
MHTVTYVYVFVRLACSLDARVPYVCYERLAARLQRRADTCRAHNMHQTDPHLLGTAPPMPPPPLLQSLPEPPLIAGCGQRAHVAGGGPTWPEGKACTHHSNGMATCSPPTWSAKNGTSKQSSAECRKTVCMNARHAHAAMLSAKQHGHRMRACVTKASSALRKGRLAHAKCSRRPGLYISALDLRRQGRANALASP